MEIFQTVTKLSEKKVRKTFGRYEIKFLPLQPFSEKRQTMVDMLKKRGKLWSFRRLGPSDLSQER